MSNSGVCLNSITGEGPTAGDHSGAPKNLSPTSYVDKQMIEAKTWVPQEVYRQPQQKPVSTQERPQFSPGKEKQAIHMRRGQEMGRKSGSPYDHGSAAADYMKKLEQGSSPNQSGKKIKQPTSASVPYPSPVMSAPSSESERSKQQEIQTGKKQIHIVTMRCTYICQEPFARNLLYKRL